MKNEEGILIQGARQNNLKNISCKIPRDKITVVTGLSGSGKSTLALDILHAEGQRNYLESLSVYARQFLDCFQKPEVDVIKGLSPSIAIDQKTINTNPRSTVGTVTEIYDFLRLLFARVSLPHCPKHKKPLRPTNLEKIVEEIFSLKKGSKIYISAPVFENKKGEFLNEFTKWIKKGFSKVKVDGRWVFLESQGKLVKNKKHTIDLLVDQVPVEIKFQKRIMKSVGEALRLAEGRVRVELLSSSKILTFSTKMSCPICSFSFPPMEPQLFSFNTPLGACSSCEGTGEIETEYEDVETGDLEFFYTQCEECGGSRLNETALSVLLEGKNIYELTCMSVEEALKYFTKNKMKKDIVAFKIIEQIRLRLGYMEQVGMGYLSLDRGVNTLSGGEAQRVRLATQLGSGLTGVTYILDEPSVGLHPRDHQKLLRAIQKVKEKGNTIVIVEHDEQTILSSDHIIDLGPGAGEKGGELIAEGNPSQVKRSKSSLTGAYLSGRKKISLPKKYRPQKDFLELQGATGNNLKNVNIKIPLGNLVGVTGVSGSGKSSLIVDTLYKALLFHLYSYNIEPLPYKKLKGFKGLEKVIEVTQRPIGRTPRSTPSTYTGVMTSLRNIFSQMMESKIQGYSSSFFSFNLKGGRCEFCEGKGEVIHKMHFLPDVSSTCESCGGRRYCPEVDSVLFKGKSIADVLNMTVDQALEFFENQDNVYRKLKSLSDVGLGYIRLGQNSVTLSGGEAQRIKLSKQLSRVRVSKGLFILDEPTTGLHFEDVSRLVGVLHRLVDMGNTVIVIEHHLDVIKNCDYILDMGPSGGVSGGGVVFQGSPQKFLNNKKSLTSPFLKNVMNL